METAQNVQALLKSIKSPAAFRILTGHFRNITIYQEGGIFLSDSFRDFFLSYCSEVSGRAAA